MNFFYILTPSIYWLLAIIWFAIMAFSLSRYRSPRLKEGVFRTLFIVLIIEAFRTFFESVYFGSLRTSEAGLISAGIAEQLVQPHWIFAPKAVNLLAGIAVMYLLFKRFSPQELAFGESQRQRITQLEESLRSVRETETRLRGSEEHYAIVVRLTGQLVYDYDIASGKIVWKGALSQITGYPETRLSDFNIGRWEEHIHPDDRKSATELLTRSMTAAAPYRVAYRFRRADGGYRWIEDNGAFVTDTNGRPVRMLGTMKDVDYQKRAEAELVGYKDRLEDLVARRTEALEALNRKLASEIEQRVQTETALRDSETLFRTAFRTHPESININRLKDGVYIDVNDGFTSLTGYSRDEVIGKSSLGINIWHDPEDRERLVRQLAARGRVHNLEARFRLKDGRIGTGLMSATILQLHGEPYILSVTLNIEERKQIENRLRKFEQIVSASKDLMALVNLDYVYEAVNAAYSEYHGRSDEEIVGRSIPELVGQVLFEEKIRPRIDRAREGHTIYYQDEFDFGGHGKCYMEVTFFPVRSADGSVEAIAFNFRDITATRHLERQLADAQKMDSIGTLAGGIAHDFNNILGVIIGQAELMELFYARESPQIRNSLGELLKAAGRAKDLVAQIMTFSRRTDRERIPLDVVPLVEETVRFLRSSLPATIEIRSDIRANGCRILANPIDIHQILMNLGTNASHAMGASGGVLEVRLDEVRLDADTARKFVGLEAGAHLCIAVSDTGCGMAPEVRDRIFEPYFTTKEVGKGTGLGLSVIHGIVKSLSGHISVYSEPGRGTTFKLMIPCREESTAKDDAPTEEGTLPTGSERILLVDDEPLNLETTGAALEGLGYQVTVAGGGAEALEQFQTARPPFDLVITDMTMPKMTGFELARRLLEMRPGLPVILCTGFSETVTRPQALRAGIGCYLEKPHPVKELAIAVRQVLNVADVPQNGGSQRVVLVNNTSQDFRRGTDSNTEVV